METATVEPGNDPMHEQNQRKDPQRERRLLAARPQAFAQEVRIERRKRNDHDDGEDCEIRPKARDGDPAGRCEQCGGRGDHEQACLEVSRDWHLLYHLREKLGLQLIIVPAPTMADLDGAFELMALERVGAFPAVASPLLDARGAPQAASARKHRLPGMFGSKENVQAGGLISYGADLTDLNRRAATYIDKILKGAKPAELPGEQASKYEMVINQKTAKA